MARDTRKRILVASLLLFNEQGAPRTTINEIADELDISPGNLNYHFRRKADIVDALAAEFQADARSVLRPPDDEYPGLDDFWLFLHELLELTGVYRFMLTDTEVLTDEYPAVGRALRHFAKALQGSFELYLHGLEESGLIVCAPGELGNVAKVLAVIALLSGRFDTMTGEIKEADDAAIGVARTILGVLKPLATEAAARQFEYLATHYSE
ncbi:MAG: TetR/AcrR family transcriptional regulator, partial [Woeseiaceae bacterium]|jgi:AcrR family transcriptional regulator|nr:TetR/AcrR family transcriptional regulator [Woeseiaceae bacterium]